MSIYEALGQLEHRDDDLAQAVRSAKVCESIDLQCTAVHLRTLAERIVRSVAGTLAAPHGSLYELLQSAALLQALAGHDAAKAGLDVLRVEGNNGAHGRTITQTAADLFAAADTVADWWLSRDRSHPLGHRPVPKAHANAHDGTGMAPPDEADFGIYLIRRQNDTTVVRLADDGLIVLRRDVPLLLFGCGDQLWEWEPIEVRAAVSHIDDLEDYWNARDGESESDVLYVPVPDGRFVNVGDGRHIESDLPRSSSLGRAIPLASHRDGTPMGWIRSIRPVPAIGRWMLVMEEDHAYHGGAHSNWETRFWAADARTGHRVDLVPMLAQWCGTRPELHAQARVLWREARIADEIETEVADVPKQLELTAARFEIGPDGRPGLQLQFTGDECSAASDGRWSSYTRSALVFTSEVPPFLAGCDGLPSTLTGWLAENLGAVTGWSRLDHSMERLLLARLDHPPEGW